MADHTAELPGYATPSDNSDGTWDLWVSRDRAHQDGAWIGALARDAGGWIGVISNDSTVVGPYPSRDEVIENMIASTRGDRSQWSWVTPTGLLVSTLPA